MLVDTRHLCTATRMFAEKSAHYQLFVSKFKGTGTTMDGKAISPEQLDWRMVWTDSDAGGRTLSALSAYNNGSCGSDKSWETAPYLLSFLRTPCNYLAVVGRVAFGIVAYPLKRTYDRPFGEFVVRYGSTGNEENFIDADLPERRMKDDHPVDRNLDETFTPTRDGELFVYLNKPALGVWPNAFYDLNSGIAKVTIIRISPKH